MKLKEARILVTDDDPDVLTAVRLLLKNKAKEVVTLLSPKQFPTLLSQQHFDIILLDMNFEGTVHTGNEGLFWLQKVKAWAPKSAVVMITAYGGVDLAVKSLKEGAADFIIKPWQNEKLIETLEEALGKKSPRKEQNHPETAANNLMMGQSGAMQDIYRLIGKVAPTDANILILGENGTGKELVAEAIHQQSGRAHHVFVKVDAGALTETLFESELFGHKKGAFTDANEERTGSFEAANGGTLFLDEIGNISLRQQAKLLNVLQNRVVSKIGEHRPTPIDIRLICATNLSRNQLADESRFRKDLMYRINTVEIVLPPLRQREGDILLLANHFLLLYGKKYFKPDLRLAPLAIEKLYAYSFPGNVRELQHAMERAVIMCEGAQIGANDLLFSPVEEAKERMPTAHPPLRLCDLERAAIVSVIDKHHGNISEAAKELGLSRATLYRRIHKLGPL